MKKLLVTLTTLLSLSSSFATTVGCECSDSTRSQHHTDEYGITDPVATETTSTTCSLKEDGKTIKSFTDFFWSAESYCEARVARCVSVFSHYVEREMVNINLDPVKAVYKYELKTPTGKTVRTFKSKSTCNTEVKRIVDDVRTSGTAKID